MPSRASTRMRQANLRLALVIGLALLALGPSLARTAAVTTKEIEESLTCQCGCGLTVHSCNHLTCGSAIPLKREIQMLVNDGLGRAEILAHFRDRYGEKILSAPTTEGFNLTAWILPFVMIFAGTVIVVVAVRRWTSRDQAASPATSAGDDLTPEERRRLDAELRRVED